MSQNRCARNARYWASSEGQLSRVFLTLLAGKIIDWKVLRMSEKDHLNVLKSTLSGCPCLSGWASRKAVSSLVLIQCWMVCNMVEEFSVPGKFRVNSEADWDGNTIGFISPLSAWLLGCISASSRESMCICVPELISKWVWVSVFDSVFWSASSWNPLILVQTFVRIACERRRSCGLLLDDLLKDLLKDLLLPWLLSKARGAPSEHRWRRRFCKFALKLL